MKNNYNLIAPFYDSIVAFVFGKAIYKAQIELFDQLPEEGNALFIGGGSGKVLKVLVERRPQLKITYLEKSKNMLALSRKKVTDAQQINFILGGLNDIPHKPYDAILTFFFLDLFEAKERQEVFDQLKSQLKTKGFWLIADFLPPKKRKYRMIESLMFAFLKVSTKIASHRIDKFQKYFTNQEFELLQEKKYYDNFIFSAIYQKLRNDS
ncbi:MAG: class I SAM-dependent methyltransferase [Vicingaceae bacterium]